MWQSRFGLPSWLNLLGGLNASLEEIPATRIERMRRIDAQQAEFQIEWNRALPAEREQQRELREIVDLYVEGENPTEAVRRLEEILGPDRFRLLLTPLPTLKRGLKVKGPLIRLQWWPDRQPEQISRASFLGLAEVLGSDDAWRLGKCQRCHTYFRADRPSVQQFCSPNCRRAAIEQRRQEGNRERYNARKAAEQKRNRQRKKQRAK